MANDVSYLDDLPNRPSSHVTEEKAETEFQQRLAESGCFILQRSDRKDYGTDCEIEVVENGKATNIRIHVQLKGTERVLNADGSLSIEISRTNLNYLLMHPHSFYAAYHVPTRSLRICLAETVLRQYEHARKDWTAQRSLRVNFTEDLTIERLGRLAELSSSAVRAARNSRVNQLRTNPENLTSLLRGSVSDVHVPDDPALARQYLKHLYCQNADEEISSAFDRFMAVLGPEDEAMDFAYMSEINLGMSRRNQASKRVEDALAHFKKELCGKRLERGSVYFTIGNAYSALDQEEDAKVAYMAALLEPNTINSPNLACQVYKNLGGSFDRLGDEKLAVEHYREALRLNPHLPEAHYGIAHIYVRKGDWKNALTHLDQAVFTDTTCAKAASVAGWRANVLFNIGDVSAGFREINGLLAQADRVPWVWPFFSRLVASFGRSSSESARHALGFWRRFLDAHPETSGGCREMLLTMLYLRAQGEDIGWSYKEFLGEFDKHIKHIDKTDEVAFLWDRLGHWAQDEFEWSEAERCFRKAYDLAGGDYGYCLGTALNFLKRFEESLPILLEQAESIQPDAMSWSQLGDAYCGLEQLEQAIDCYKKAIDFDPNYERAMFNLGGIYWNRGDRVEALDIWRTAVERFPDHELTAKLQDDLPMFFPQSG